MNERTVTPSPDPPIRGASSQDVRNLYMLLLGRPPESDFVARGRPEHPVARVAMDFLTSPEFGRLISSAAATGRLTGAAEVPPVLRAWACEAFGIELRAGTGRQAAVVAILKRADVQAALRSALLTWSIDEILAQLDTEPPPGSAPAIVAREGWRGDAVSQSHRGPAGWDLTGLNGPFEPSPFGAGSEATHADRVARVRLAALPPEHLDLLFDVRHVQATCGRAFVSSQAAAAAYFAEAPTSRFPATPLFDPVHYAGDAQTFILAGTDPYAHFLAHAGRRGPDPNA